MTDYSTPLSGLLERIPRSLECYFDRIAGGGFSDLEQHGINFLPPSQVAELTHKFRGFHPLIQLTNAIVLDDANTSNYHCYVPALPIPESVVYLNHDGDTRVVFNSLDGLVDAADKAKQCDGWLEDSHFEISPLSDQQAQLNQCIGELFSRDD